MIAQPFALVQQVNQLLHDRQFLGGLGVARPDLLFHPLLPAIQGLHVGEHQFGLDRLDVVQGIHTAAHMHHVGILEAPDDVHQGIHLANLRQELVPQSLALARPFHQAGNVADLQRAWRHLFRAEDVDQLVEARVGHRGDPDVGLHGGKGIIGHHRPGADQGIEHGGLPDVRQSDHSAAESHIPSPFPLP